MSKQRTGVNDINSRERMNQALGLRKAGCTLDMIAQQCGYGSKSSAHKAIRRAMSELPVENALELRALEVQRLDELMQSHWGRAKKEIPSAYLVVKIIETRCRLLGLNVENDATPLAPQVLIREIPNQYLSGPTPGAIIEAE